MRTISFTMPLTASPPVHEIFKALAHPARVQVIRELSDGGERCVCDLVEACGLGWSMVSRHLSVLREAGLIVEERRGTQIFNRLALPCVVRFIDCLEQPDRYPELQGSGACCS